MRIVPVATAALLLAGCGTAPKPEPVVVTKEVQVPVPVSCVPKRLGDEPAYVDTDEALRDTAGPEDMLQLLYAGRKQRLARAGEVEPVITSCRNAGQK